MSRENVELIQRVYEEFGRTREAVEWALDADVEWHTAADLPDSDVHRGPEAVAALVRSWVESFDDFGADVEAFIDRGEYVVVPLVLRGRMRGSAEEVALPETHVWRVRDGKVVEVREYRTREAALDALTSGH
jgi:ketosteroid isomerase-like protein